MHLKSNSFLNWRSIYRQILVCTFISLSFLNFANSAKIEKVKGNRAMIHLESESTKVGDYFVALDSQNKKRAVLKILSIKSNKAIAQISRGSAEAGQKAQLVQGNAHQSETSLKVVPNSTLSNFGILGSYLINSMTAKFTLNGEKKSSSMSGTGFGVLGYYDYTLGASTQLRGSVGLEQFQAAENRATADCNSGTSTTCNVSITYLSTYGLFKYYFLNGWTKAWFGGGLGYLIALSKSSSVLQTSEISTNSIYNLAAGIDVNMKKGQYLPIVLEYSIFPSSASVSASFVAIRVGWGWR